jgi:SAM-dependent methyltransferase
VTDPDFSDFRDAFSRLDESDDRIFYSRDRFVSHLDTLALATIEDLVGQLLIERRPVILDLMASWDSHIPAVVSPTRVVGLGLNHNELERNEALTERVIHDVNREPTLPFESGSFDAVLCTVSVDYMTRPVEVFREVGRLLKPGGLFLVTFSNRFFPPKVVKIWRESSEIDRLQMVQSFFAESGGFGDPEILVSKGRPRPPEDAYADRGLPSDPVYAVYADRKGGTRAHRPRPVIFGTTPPPDPETVRERSARVGVTLRCPHCDRRLERWKVPQTPFTQWASEYQYLCFNDDCPYYVRGWTALAGQGNPGSYRFMFDPESGGCHSVPVLTPHSLRESIVPREDSHGLENGD